MKPESNCTDISLHIIISFKPAISLSLYVRVFFFSFVFFLVSLVTSLYSNDNLAAIFVCCDYFSSQKKNNVEKDRIHVISLRIYLNMRE